MLARQFLTAAHDACDTFVIDRYLVRCAAFTVEVEQRPSIANKANVAVAQGGEAETVVVARIFRIADADLRRIEQADDHGEHFLARQTRQGQIAPQTTPKFG